MASIRRPISWFTSPLDTFSMLNIFVWEKSGDFSFLGLLRHNINKIIKVKFWNDVGTAVGLILDQTKAQSIYTPESTYLVELRMFALLSGLWKYLFQKDEYCILILGLDNAGKSVSWAGFIFSLTITYVPLCGGYDPVSQFFRKLRSFEDGPLLSIGWISLFRNFILVHVTIPCRDHLYHTLPIYLLCLPRKGGLDAFF